MIDASATQIVVFGREIRVPWSADGVCKFTFSELCDEVRHREHLCTR